jgi:hypothetical protein
VGVLIHSFIHACGQAAAAAHKTQSNTHRVVGLLAGGPLAVEGRRACTAFAVLLVLVLTLLALAVAGVVRPHVVTV